MAEPLAEYTVRDYSAVDAQVAQIAERERILTNKLKLANVKQALILAAGGLLAVGVFLLLAGIAYRIAFPSKPEVIEKTEIVEKVIDPQEIIINIPAGSTANQNQNAPKLNNGSIWGENKPGSDPTSPTSESNNEPAATFSGSKSTTKESEKAASVIGSRCDHFYNVPSNTTGFNNVVTGCHGPIQMLKGRIDSTAIEKLSGIHTTAVDLATIEGGVGSPKSLYSTTVPVRLA